MIQKIFFLVLCAAPFFTKAQLSINAQLPPAGLVQKDQLWNLVISNNKADVLDVSIKMNLQDAVTGQVVLSASTGNILIGKGVKIISIKDIQPVLYNYNVQELSRTNLPMGAYTACYRLLSNNGERQDVLGEDCISINIDPLSPPLLNTPADKSDVQTPYPQFSWMPPAPFDMFNNLSYDLLVKELLPNQNATEAIQYNTPIYSRTNINQPYETYAGSFTKLEIGKTYAWQVVAKNGLSYAAKTEVWTFKFVNEIAPVATDDDSYLLLDNRLTGTYKIAKNVLHVKYYSNNLTYTAKLIFKDEKGNTIKQATQQIVAGDNYFDVDIANHFAQKNVYTFSLIDNDNIAHSLTFSIYKK
jgi:hypothetical protein